MAWICGDFAQCTCTVATVKCRNVQAAPRFPAAARKSRTLDISVIDGSQFDEESLDMSYGFKTTTVTGMDVSSCRRVISRYPWVNCLTEDSTTGHSASVKVHSTAFIVDHNTIGHDTTRAASEPYDDDDDYYIDGDYTDDKSRTTVTADDTMSPISSKKSFDAVTTDPGSKDKHWWSDSPLYFYGSIVSGFVAGLLLTVAVIIAICCKCCGGRQEPQCLVKCCNFLCKCCLAPIRCIGYLRGRRSNKYAMHRMARFDSDEHFNISTTELNNN